MYHYDDFDAAFVAARVEQFRDQVARRLSGELTEEQFRPHRLMNGLYLREDFDSDKTLSPGKLDRILDKECGERPTVVVVSACLLRPHVGSKKSSPLMTRRAWSRRSRR